MLIGKARAQFIIIILIEGAEMVYLPLPLMPNLPDFGRPNYDTMQMEFIFFVASKESGKSLKSLPSPL